MPEPGTLRAGPVRLRLLKALQPMIEDLARHGDPDAVAEMTQRGVGVLLDLRAGKALRAIVLTLEPEPALVGRAPIEGAMGEELTEACLSVLAGLSAASVAESDKGLRALAAVACDEHTRALVFADLRDGSVQAGYANRKGFADLGSIEHRAIAH